MKLEQLKQDRMERILPFVSNDWQSVYQIRDFGLENGSKDKNYLTYKKGLEDLHKAKKVLKMKAPNGTIYYKLQK